MKLRSTFSLVTKETRACEAGAPLDGAPPKPLRPGRSWKKARALRSRLIDGIVVRRQCTSALSGSAPAIVIDSSAQLTARSHSDRRQSIKRRRQIWAQPWLKVEGNENRESGDGSTSAGSTGVSGTKSPKAEASFNQIYGNFG